MQSSTLLLLHYFLFVFHNIIILINLFGWIFKPTRKLQWIVISLTTLSWFVLGAFYGFGYCILTDIHYEVLYKLGFRDLPNSYIKYLIDSSFHVNSNALYVDIGTGIGYVIAVIGGVWSYNKR